MWDTLLLTCPNPNCRGKIEVTVYSGLNQEKIFTIDDAPLSIIDEVSKSSKDGEIMCTVCGLHVLLAVQFITEVVELGSENRRWREC